MVQNAISDGIPTHGAYAVRAPQAADALAMPLRAAFREETRLPYEIEKCLERLHRVRIRR